MYSNDFWMPSITSNQLTKLSSLTWRCCLLLCKKTTIAAFFNKPLCSTLGISMKKGVLAGILLTVAVELSVVFYMYGIPFLWNPEIRFLEKLINRSLPNNVKNTWNYSEHHSWNGDRKSISLFSLPDSFGDQLVKGCSEPAILRKGAEIDFMDEKFNNQSESNVCVWTVDDAKGCEMRIVAWTDFIAKNRSCN